MKQRKISKTNVVNFSTYLGMVVFFLVMTVFSKAGVLNRSMTGLLVPICCYMSMAVSLNLTVGILGELSLGHAGFMSVGAFAGVIASQSLLDVVPSAGLRLSIPTEKRINSGPMPQSFSCWSVSWRWVVLAGCSTQVRASAT